MTPRLIFDVHLDLAWNAIEYNRDQRWTQERLRRREIGMTDHVFRSRSTVCFPEMRRGNVGLCVATQLARYVPYFGRWKWVHVFYCLPPGARPKKGDSTEHEEGEETTSAKAKAKK